MSIIPIFIGQCGNQIGNEINKSIFNCIVDKSYKYNYRLFELFFDVDSKNNIYSNSILIDMEPKVIDNICNTAVNFKYKKNNCYFKQEGSGNNWAYGYNYHGKNNINMLMDILRNNIEQKEAVDCIIIINSLAGGTGSGLGSCYINSIKSEFNNIDIFNISIMPKLSGEIILQNYNTILSLYNIYEDCNGIMILQNDAYNNICINNLSIKTPNISDLNGVISEHMTPFFIPNNGKKYDFISNRFNDLVVNPSLKLVNPKFIPQVI